MKLAVLILTYNEELHLQRCINSASKVADKIFILDSYSTDQTISIANKNKINVIQRAFDSYPNQLNFGIDTIPIEFQYILRVDADEILSESLIERINLIKKSNTNTPAFFIKRKIVFNGKILNYGGMNRIYIVRLFNRNFCKVDGRIMDEKILFDGRAEKISEPLIDINLNTISYWINKHNRYSTLEAEQVINEKNSIIKDSPSLKNRFSLNSIYYFMPMFLRCFIYFFVRYFLLFGFLDGKNGFTFHFLQALWYRYLVDLKISAMNTTSKISTSKYVIKHFDLS